MSAPTIFRVTTADELADTIRSARERSIITDALEFVNFVAIRMGLDGDDRTRFINRCDPKAHRAVKEST